MVNVKTRGITIREKKMLNVVIVALLVASSIWVYLDATKHKIGKVSGAKGMFNMSAGAWAVVTLLLWIVGFPAYLIKRSNLIQGANENPIEVSGRIGKTAALAVVGGVWILAVFSSIALSSLPSCSDSNTKTLVGQIVNKMPLVKVAGAQFIALKDIVEQGYNKQSEIRSCHATLVTTAGEDSLQYYVKWKDKGKGNYYVQVQIQ